MYTISIEGIVVYSILLLICIMFEEKGKIYNILNFDTLKLWCLTVFLYITTKLLAGFSFKGLSEIFIIPLSIIVLGGTVFILYSISDYWKKKNLRYSYTVNILLFLLLIGMSFKG